MGRDIMSFIKFFTPSIAVPACNSNIKNLLHGAMCAHRNESRPMLRVL